MSLIRLHARPLPSDPFTIDLETEAHRWAGELDTATSVYWVARPRRVETHDTSRVWRTAQGRWVLTTPAWGSYVTEQEAHAWLARQEYDPTDPARLEALALPGARP